MVLCTLMYSHENVFWCTHMRTCSDVLTWESVNTQRKGPFRTEHIKYENTFFFTQGKTTPIARVRAGQAYMLADFLAFDWTKVSCKCGLLYTSCKCVLLCSPISSPRTWLRSMYRMCSPLDSFRTCSLVLTEHILYKGVSDGALSGGAEAVQSSL
jgi:hypothetical protein